jgi:UDP-glucose 4-epimerase
VRRIVFASSAAVYGQGSGGFAVESSPKWPLSPYGWAKLASEALVFNAAQAGGNTALCLRYFNVYGPRQDPQSSYAGVLSIFSSRIAIGEPISVYGAGNQTRDFVHVSDVARANVLAATGEILQSAALNICTGRAVSLNEVIAVLQKLHCKKVQIHHLPKRGGDIEDSCGSPKAARVALGFQAECLLEDGLKDSV